MHPIRIAACTSVALYCSPTTLKHSSQYPRALVCASLPLVHPPGFACGCGAEPDRQGGRGCRRHTGRWSGMPAIIPVTVMTRVLPRKWHVHLGFILSPRPRRALDRHTRLENHLADPDSSHSGLCTSLPRNQDKRDRGAAGPLDGAHGSGCAEPLGARKPAPELCPGGTWTTPVMIWHRPYQRDNAQAVPEQGCVPASTPQDLLSESSQGSGLHLLALQAPGTASHWSH